MWAASLLIVLTPVVVELVKILNKKLNKWVPNLPKWSIPLIAICVGLLLNLIPVLSGMYSSQWAGMMIGLAGIGLREVSVGLKKHPRFAKYFSQNSNTNE